MSESNRVFSTLRRSGLISSISLFAALTCLLTLLCLAGCSDDKPTQPNDKSNDRLAGGGRESDTDPFIGGIGDSGPNDSLPVLPGFDSTTQYFPIFVSQQSCPQQQSYQIITDQDELDEWWDAANNCSNGQWKPAFIPIPDSSDTGTTTPPDSGWVTPDSLWPGGAPVVNFSDNIVVIIALAEGISGRYTWINMISEDDDGTDIYYEVMAPGNDCFNILVDPYMMATPVTAFVIPRPLHLTFGWFPTNSTYNCTWEPDPNEPVTLYYTDAPCESGYTTGIIFEEHIFRDFLETTWQCESERWNGLGDSVIVNPDSSVISEPGTPPGGLMHLVDFSTHAILILKAEPQDRWGGGIWLNSLTTEDGVTMVDYSEMIPSEGCPPVDGGGRLEPMVVIRIPRPSRVDYTLSRNTERISCDWPIDTTWVRPE